MIKQILMDMDGVVADFFTPAVLAQREAAAAIGITKARDMDIRYPYGKWDIAETLGLTNAEMWARIDNYDFWFGLPCFEGAREFIRGLDTLIAPVAFCTSASLHSDCAKAKIDWLHLHIGSSYPVYLCYKGGKEVMAKPENLLVDDYHKNTAAFFNAGGSTVLVPRPWSCAKEQPGVSYLTVDYASLYDTIVKAVHLTNMSYQK